MLATASTGKSAVPHKSSRSASSGGFATRRARGISDGARFPMRRAALVGLVFTPLALFSAAFSSAVVLDTREPQVSRALYGELPKAKVRLGDLAIAEAFSDLGSVNPGAIPGAIPDTNGARRPARLPPSASELAAQLPAATRQRIEAQALSGLADTPYASGALRQLAFVEPDPARRRKLLDLARQVSRRDVSAATQLAELQLRDGALAEGLATLDTALQISDALDARIFPLVLNAARIPRFEDELRDRLARDPAWAERFARHAAGTPASARLFARIVDGFPKASRARSIDYGAPIVDQLATQLEPAAAFAAYRAYAEGAQDPSAFGTRPLPPLDWRLIDAITVGTRKLGTGDPLVELFAQPRRAGEVARIMLQLEPGAYALTLALADPRGSGGTLTLARTCLADGRELERSEASASLDAARVRLGFDVPADCPYQSLRLGVAAGGEEVSVLVDDVALNPATGAS